MRGSRRDIGGRRRRAAAVLATGTLLALLVAPFTAGAAVHHGDAPGDPADEAVATLEIEHDQVAVRRDGKARFRPARDGQAIGEGDTVRTDATGRATIQYTDDSFTRLDVDTTFVVVELIDDEGTRHTRGSLQQGQVWNRVEDLAETETFETEGAGAVAATTGTAYSVTCTDVDECTYTGVVHDLLLRWLAEELLEGDEHLPSTIDELEFVVVRRGQGGIAGELTLEEFFADEWIQLNLRVDIGLGYPGPDRFVGVTITRTVTSTGTVVIEVGGISVTKPDAPPSNPPPSNPPPTGGQPNGFGAGGGTNQGGASFDDGSGHPVGNCMASGAHHKNGGGKPDPGTCLNG